MAYKLRDYKPFVGSDVISSIESSAEPLRDKHVAHVNSTSSGGGVAEMLNSLVILMNGLGLEAGWRLLKGTHSFFDVTKKFHNALQGESIHLTNRKKKIYIEEIERNSIMNHFNSHDLVIVHDPQPLAMVKYSRKKQPWLWRCHIDIHEVHTPTWHFLSQFIREYNGMVVSMKKYMKPELDIPQHVMAPSIDPLSLKNMRLRTARRKKILSKNGIDNDRPLLCQVSRFDKWKNPKGVIKIFEKVREKINAQLVLIGDMAPDDPESHRIYADIDRIVRHNSHHKHIKLITKRDDALVNALQAESTVVMQNSRKEGFGLVVSEALWKGTPVVSTNKGGLPLQVIDGETGFVVRNNREAVKRCVQLITDERLRNRLGRQAREHVRKNFLITRHLKDHLYLMNQYMK